MRKGDADQPGSEQPGPLVRRPESGQFIQGPAGGRLRFQVRGTDTGGRLTALVNDIAPGDGPPLHVHEACDESWWIIEGMLRFRLGDEIAEAPAGSFVFVPRGTPHCFQNAGSVTARILVLFAPSGMEHFFDAFAAVQKGVDVPEAFAQAAAAADMTIVGPPLGRDVT